MHCMYIVHMGIISYHMQSGTIARTLHLTDNLACFSITSALVIIEYTLSWEYVNAIICSANGSICIQTLPGLMICLAVSCSHVTLHHILLACNHYARGHIMYMYGHLTLRTIQNGMYLTVLHWEFTSIIYNPSFCYTNCSG